MTERPQVIKNFMTYKLCFYYLTHILIQILFYFGGSTVRIDTGKCLRAERLKFNKFTI